MAYGVIMSNSNTLASYTMTRSNVFALSSSANHTQTYPNTVYSASNIAICQSENGGDPYAHMHFRAWVHYDYPMTESNLKTTMTSLLCGAI